MERDPMDEHTDAILAYILRCANDIVDGRMSPRVGAATLFRLHKDVEELTVYLTNFEGLWSELDCAGAFIPGLPERDVVEVLERDVVEEATRLRRTLKGQGYPVDHPPHAPPSQ